MIITSTNYAFFGDVDLCERKDELWVISVTYFVFVLGQAFDLGTSSSSYTD